MSAPPCGTCGLRDPSSEHRAYEPMLCSEWSCSTATPQPKGHEPAMSEEKRYISPTTSPGSEGVRTDANECWTCGGAYPEKCPRCSEARSAAAPQPNGGSAVEGAPYYDDGTVTVFNADCLTILPLLADAAAVITDPPYNVGIVYGGTDDRRTDYADWCQAWFKQCRRIAPTVAITPGVANVGIWHRMGDDPDWTIAWHKPAAMGRCHVGFNNWEPVLLWGKAAKQTADVITAPLIPDPDLDGHPCPKPIKWATSLMGMLTQPGELVVDPFMGSGTTLRAARDMGRRYIGIEVEARFCEMAVRRLDQGVLDLGAAA